MQSIAFVLFTSEPTGSIWGEYLKTLSVLAGICILAMAAAKLLAPRLRTTLPGAKRIRILATQPLEPRKTLYIVKAGDAAVLLATSGNAVHFLTRLEGDAALELEPDTELSRAPMSLNFATFASFLRGRQSRRQP
jgi:flagellar biogenesis protein FliO